MMLHVIAGLFCIGGLLQLVGLVLVWVRLKKQRREVEKRDLRRAEFAQRHRLEMDAAQASFLASFEGDDVRNSGTTMSEGEAAWLTSDEYRQLTQRHQAEDAEAGVAGMTLGEVDDLFARGPDAAVQFLVAQQLSGYGLQIGVVGTGTALGVIGSVMSIYLLPIG